MFIDKKTSSLFYQPAFLNKQVSFSANDARTLYLAECDRAFEQRFNQPSGVEKIGRFFVGFAKLLSVPVAVYTLLSAANLQPQLPKLPRIVPALPAALNPFPVIARGENPFKSNFMNPLNCGEPHLDSKRTKVKKRRRKQQLKVVS